MSLIRNPLSLLRLALATTLLTGSLSAQSLDVNTAAPLAAGANKATIDSFGGDQFWKVTVGPGAFTITFRYGGPQEGFSTGGHPVMECALNPKVPGSTLTSKQTPGAISCIGTVNTPSRLLIGVTPTKGALVRQTTAYTIEATGSASFSAAASGPAPAAAIAGIYSRGDMTAKFLPNGDIKATDGSTGHWELFDADSKTYVVTLGGQRYTVTYQPGRGLVDNNNNIAFTRKN